MSDDVVSSILYFLDIRSQINFNKVLMDDNQKQYLNHESSKYFSIKCLKLKFENPFNLINQNNNIYNN